VYQRVNSFVSVIIRSQYSPATNDLNDIDDLSYFFIHFSFENDLSPLVCEHIKQRYIRGMIAMFGKSDIRFLS